MNSQTIVSSLRQLASTIPEQGAFYALDGEGQIAASLTYGDLDRRARTIAVKLMQRCESPDAPVLVLYPEGLDFITAFMGCLYAGRIAVPAPFPGALRSQRDGRHLRAIAADAAAGLILTASTGAHLDDTSIPVLVTDGLDVSEGDVWHPQAQNNEVAYLQYTSGSTAAPKAAVVTHVNLSNSLTELNEAWKYDAGSVVLTWMPHVHDFGLVEGLLRPLGSGVPCYIMLPWSFVRRPARWLDAIGRYRVTHSGGATFAYDWCVRRVPPADRTGLDLGSWQVAVIGAEPIHPDVVTRFMEAFAPYGFRDGAFCPAYGLAESTLLVTANAKDAMPVLRELTIDQRCVQYTGCGFTRGETRVKIVDPRSCKVCAEGQVGEVWVKGAGVVQGYWRQPEASVAVFQGYLAETGEGPFLRTGDLGLIDQDELFITGRLKDLIIIRGQNYYPQDIEWAIERSHPSLRQGHGAVFAITSGGEERVVVAFEVASRTPNELDGVSLATAIRQTVAYEWEVPVFAVILLRRGTLPKTSSGKVQRQATCQAWLAGELDVVFEWRFDLRPHAVLSAALPTSELEIALAQIWCELLNLDEVGVDENFFALGGDSLTAMRLIVAVEDAYEYRVSEEFVREPTVAHLARLIANPETAPDTISASQTITAQGPQISQQLRRHIVRTGPVVRNRHLPYALGVRLQRWWLSLPQVRKSFFQDEVELIRHWELLVDRPGQGVLQSLMINTWLSWRTKALDKPDTFERWVAIEGEKAFQEREGQGVVIVSPHTGLNLVLQAYLHRQENVMVTLRGKPRRTHHLMKPKVTTDHHKDYLWFRTQLLVDADSALRRGGSLLIAGDGRPGSDGSTLPFYGRQRTYQLGAATLAVQTGSLFVPVFPALNVNGQIKLEFTQPLLPGSGSERAMVEDLTRQYAELVTDRWPSDVFNVIWPQLKSQLRRPLWSGGSTT